MLDIPYLWGTISELVTKGKKDKVILVKTFEGSLRSSQAETLDLFDNLKDKLQTVIDEATKLSVKKVTDLRRRVVIAKAIKQGVEQNIERLDSLESQPSINAHVDPSNTCVGL